MTISFSAWDREIKQFHKDALGSVRDKRNEVVSIAYEYIIANSPVWSGYYAANHVILIGGTERTGGGFPRRPAERPERVARGAFVDLIDTNAEAMLGRLHQDPDGPVRKVTIGTSVPYAEFISGEHLYNTAAAIALSQF